MEEIRFYTRGRISGIMVPQLAEIQIIFFMIGVDNWIKKRVINWLYKKEGDTHRNTQNAALNVGLFWNMFCWQTTILKSQINEYFKNNLYIRNH